MKKKAQEIGLFINDISIHFEYGHAIPESETCSVIHGHSGRIEIEVWGFVNEHGMMVEFRLVKEALKKVASYFDAQFIIAQQYATRKNNHYHISFEGSHGQVELLLPVTQTITLPCAATIESIAYEMSTLLLQELPAQIVRFKVKVFEGMAKGAVIERFRESYEADKKELS